MRYYYVPSSYRGRRFGKGIRGGALRGLGFVAGGSLKGGFTSIPVVPSQIANVTNNPEQVAAVQTAEATGQPTNIGKHLYNLWGDISSLAKSGWNAFKNSSPTTKTIAGLVGLRGIKEALGTQTGRNIAMKGFNLLDKLGDKGIISGGLDLASIAYPTLKLPATALKMLGLGYGGGRRFRKGSPEAKAFMARLRAMRRRKTGRGIRALGYGGGRRFRKGSPEAKAFMARLRAMRKGRRKGGMFYGITYDKLDQLVAQAQTRGDDFVTVTDAYRQEHVVPMASARKMLSGFKKMTDFWKGKSAKQRSDYIKSHYLSGSTHEPWKNMTMARLAKILNRTSGKRYPKRFIARRGTHDFVEEWGKLLKPPRDNKAKMFQALLKKMIVMNKLARNKNKKLRKLRPKLLPFDNFESLLLQLDDFKNGHVDIGKKQKMKGKNAYKKFKETADQADITSWERDEDGNLIVPDDFDDDLESDDEDYVPPKYSKDKEDDDFDDVPD